MRNSGLNAATVWCFMPMPVPEGDNILSRVMEYYPGDEWVDWWAVDLFSTKGMINSKPFLREAHSHRKPMMIGESTPKGIGVLDGRQSWDQWFVPYFKLIHDHPGIKAFCYINWNWAKYAQWKNWGDARLQQNAVFCQPLQEGDVTPSISTCLNKAGFS